MRSHLPWPFPVPVEAQRELGFARFNARLAEVRRLLDLSGLAPVPPNAERVLSADERRLLADRPPHWGL